MPRFPLITPNNGLFRPPKNLGGLPNREVAPLHLDAEAHPQRMEGMDVPLGGLLLKKGFSFRPGVGVVSVVLFRGGGARTI